MTSDSRKAPGSTTEGSSGTALPHQEDAMNSTLEFLKVQYGNTSGYAVIVGIKNLEKPGQQIDTKAYSWPADAETAAAVLDSLAAAGHDAYFTTTLRDAPNRKASESNPVEARWIHCDVDGEVDLDRVAEVDGMAVASGTPGHGHVYVKVDRALRSWEFKQLCSGLRTYFGGDADNKISDCDILRVPGTVNTKTEPPLPTYVMVEWEGHEYDVDDLAAKLGVSLTYEKSETDYGTLSPEPCTIPDAVVVELRAVNHDRSIKTIRALNACAAAGLSKGSAKWAIAGVKELKERMLERGTELTDKEIHDVYATSLGQNPEFQNEKTVMDEMVAAILSDQDATPPPVATVEEQIASAPSDFDIKVAQGIEKYKITEEVKRKIREIETEDAEYQMLPIDAVVERAPADRVEGLIPWDANTIIVAQRKTGKTVLTLNIAHSLITGEDLLGRFKVRPVSGCVLYLSFEMNQAQLAKWAEGLNIPSSKLMVVSLRGLPNPFRSEALLAKLKAAILRGGIQVDTVIVDTFAQAFPGSEQNSNTEVSRFLSDLRIFTQNGLGAKDLIVTVHAGWGGDGRGVQRSRGASALEDWPDSIIRLTKDDAGVRELEAIGRDIDIAKESLDYSESTKRYTMSGMSAAARKSHEKALSFRQPILDIITATPGIGFNAIEDAMKVKIDPMTDKPYEFSKGKTVRDAVEILTKSGRISVETKGRSHSHFIVPDVT